VNSGKAQMNLHSATKTFELSSEYLRIISVFPLLLKVSPVAVTDSYLVSSMNKNWSLNPSSSQPKVDKGKEFSSTPTMAKEMYSDILKVIYDAGKSMEKKPALYKG
ncbi:MAG: hypothetical protein AAFP89_27570, partial [Bacteroidota bacterium]